MTINSSDPDVAEVMDMVLGDYFEVLVEVLEDQMKDGVITPIEQMNRYVRFSRGCRKICKGFGIDADVYDVDHHLASELMCDHYKEGEQNDGVENNC
jgi:hypothetical protein